MTIGSKALLAALFLALPLPSASAVPSGGDRTPRAVVVSDLPELADPSEWADLPDLDDGDDTVQIDAPSPHPRVRIFRGDGGSRLGISLVDITAELRTHFGAPKDAGVLVGGVEKDSPASRAGIEVGDVVTSIDGKGVATPWEVARAIRRKSGGETVSIDVVRKGTAKKLTAKVEERPREDAELHERFGRDFGREINREVRRGLRNVRPFVYGFDFNRDHDEIRTLPGSDLKRLREKLENLERRLKDLEGRKAR